ncbi:MAG: AraC family transcriptional regulator [Pseudomonadota bacterium]
MKPLTIQNHFVASAIRGAQRQGYSLSEILAGTGIAPELLNRPMARVDPGHFVRLIQRLWQLLGDEYMGLAEGKSRPGTFATMCQLVIHAPNLEVMLKRGCRFYSLFEGAPQLHLETRGDSAFLILDSALQHSDEDHFLEESLFVIWHRTACWMVDQLIPLISARFAYPPPPHAEAYRDIFNTELQFDCEHSCLEFPAKLLSLPVVQSERTLVEFLRHSPADLLARPARDESFGGRIRALIGYDLECELPAFEEIAEELGVSPQTLRRRLKEEGTSYQALKDSIRRDIAIHCLGSPQLSINDIALKVGFAEPSAFHRAFKKWTGVTPADYRSQGAS